MSLSKALRKSIESALTQFFSKPYQIHQFRPCSGGCINQSGFLEAPAFPDLFVKYNSNSPAGMFEAEYKGLKALAATKTIKVPQPYAFSDQDPAFLVMEKLIEGPKTTTWTQRFAQDLAALHRQSSPNYGFESDNFIGATPQINTWRKSWLDFFRDERLSWQFERIRQNNPVSKALCRDFESLLGKLEQRLDLPNEVPALIHGDLWSGNHTCLADGLPAIYDPAAYYGCREADLAMTELFGRLPESFYEAYHDAFPLQPGYEQRRDLYNLYHMLNHWNLFGASYESSCKAIIKRFC